MPNFLVFESLGGKGEHRKRKYKKMEELRALRGEIFGKFIFFMIKKKTPLILENSKRWRILRLKSIF